MPTRTHSAAPTPDGPDAAGVLAIVREALEGKKGESILCLDVRGRTDIADYFVLASGNNSPHRKALFGAVQRALKDVGIHAFRKGGDVDHEWMVLDYLDVVVHILSPRAREYYAIEELWHA